MWGFFGSGARPCACDGPVFLHQELMEILPNLFLALARAEEERF